MKFLLLIIMCIAITLQYEQENGLYILNNSNFENFITEHEHTLAFFYTPGCGHCEKFQPEVEKAAQNMQSEGFFFGKLEAEANKETAKTYDVTGYPTLLYFNKFGKNKISYESGTGRSYDAIQQWLFQQVNPGTKELQTLEDIKEEIENNPCMFIFFGDDSKDRTFRRYREFSFTMKQASFFHTFLTGAQKAFELKKTEQLVAFKKYDHSRVIFQPKTYKIQDLKNFVEMNLLRRMSELDDTLFQKLINKDKQGVLLFTKDQSENDKAVYQQLYDISLNHPYEDYVIFASVKSDSPYWNQIAVPLGLTLEKLDSGPKIFSILKNATVRFQFTQELNEKNLENFIFDCRESKGQKHYRSQDLSQVDVQKYPNVEIINAEGYLEKVHKSQLDVIVCFYDEKNTGHNDILKTFSKVATRLSKNQNIKFLLVDAIQNEFPDFEENVDLVKLRLYKGDEKRTYQRLILRANKIQEDRLVNFIYDHTSYPWVGTRDDL